MAQLKLMKKEWFDWFKNTTLDNITAWTEYYYINPDSQHWISNYQIWNEEWEEGHWDSSTGLPVTRQGKIRNKTPIPCLPNTTYHQINNTGGLNLYFFDKNGDYLGASTFLESVGNDNEFTTPSDAYFINFSTFGSSATTYNNDICISVSNPNFNGHYEPYIIKIEDILGVVDLGSLNWTYADHRFRARIDDIYIQSNSELPKAFISNDYTPRTASTDFDTVDDSYTIILSSNIRYILVRDNSYTNVTEFKEAMNGVYLVYLKKDSPLGR